MTFWSHVWLNIHSIIQRISDGPPGMKHLGPEDQTNYDIS